jgi:hypothetical protein
MEVKILGTAFREDLLSLKSSKERIDFCEKEGLVYLGEGYVISKEDYNKVIITEQRIRYGEDLDEK